MNRLLLVPLLALCLTTPLTAQESPTGEQLLDRAVAETLAAARGQLDARDLARFQAAIEYARAAHHGQTRDGGKPFMLHPLRVARSVLTQPSHVTAEALMAAALHDVVEDTSRSLAELRARFGPRVAALVDALSLPPVERYADKQARDRAYYERFAQAPRDAQVVKFHDRLDNVRDMAGWSAEGRLRYLDATRAQVIASLQPRSPDLARALSAELATLRTRIEAELRSAEYRLDHYRRADGTLRWKPLLRDGALREGGGLAHFTLALFLKELTLVVHTGDRLRIEEFFDGLTQTDFYVHYGLFAAGARAGEVVYARTLQRLVKPRFVSGLLRTQVALAAGLALPQLVAGELEGEAFAISLGSLGLSVTAVRSGLAGLSSLGARATGGRFGLRVGRLARAGGWLITVAETAVVLLLADAIDQRVRAWRDAREARAALAEAGVQFFAAVQQPTLDDAQLEAALTAYAEAWDAWRAWLGLPLAAEEARLTARLARLAREAQRESDHQAAALGQRDHAPALRERLDAYAAERAASGDAELAADLEAALGVYQRARDAHLARITAELPRAQPYLAGAPLEAALTPPAETWFGRLTGDRARAQLMAALADATPTRPNSYRDQAAALAAARALLPAARRAALDAVASRLGRELELDRELLGASGALRTAR